MKKYRLLILLCISTFIASMAFAEDRLELDSIEVETQAQETEAINQKNARRRARNATLGGYLDSLANVDSASYGEGVGRPVVRGMSGYRVKILQNDVEVSDLSAMSQDHAVAVAPRASERIELLKGPASLLYSASAGGIVRISDQLDASFPEPGLHGRQSLDWRPSPFGKTLDSRLSLANSSWGLRLNLLDQANDPYESDGKVIPTSDVATRQGQAALDWRLNEQWYMQLSALHLDKDYGIPNATPKATRIDMERDELGFRLQWQPESAWLDQLKLEFADSDYLHDETEGGRRDGLFGQAQKTAALDLAWMLGSWQGSTRLAFTDSQLQVCHEHGACERFTKASRNGGALGESVLQYWENTGLAYSHGHPMPDTQADRWQLSSWLLKPLSEADELSVGMHWLQRSLSAYPDNIQQQWVYPSGLDADYYAKRSDSTSSVSLGWQHYSMQNAWGWDISLSYLERLPSVDEIYWNGFHHATDSYIFGNHELKKESSINLDVDVNWQAEDQQIELSAFVYEFSDYIYQDIGRADNGNQLIDPFHLSDVWITRQTDTRFLGASLRYENQMLEVSRAPINLYGQVDWIDGRFKRGGHIPRTSPASLELGAIYTKNGWLASFSIKRVDRARKLAAGEANTPGYSLISLYLEKSWRWSEQQLKAWFKGHNLGDKLAYNHLSFLKETAPLPGRQLSAGVIWAF